MIDELRVRADGRCELCERSEGLTAFAVTPHTEATAEHGVVVCDVCRPQLEAGASLDAHHWRCLQGTIWSEVSAAQSELERAKQELGAEGGDNPRIRSAVASLGEAELDLEWTTLKAPSRGAVVDLKVDEGTFAQAGQPLMTFISGDDVWVEAFLTENNLGLVSIGDPVKITLDVHPGRVIDGVVASLGAAASAGRASGARTARDAARS